MASGTEYKLAIRIAGSVDPSVKQSASKAQSLFGTIVKADLVSGAIKKAAPAFTGFVSDAVETYTTFNQSMANTAAIAGATEEEYAALNDAARAAGKATSFTAAETADALGYMALAGWDVATSTEALTPILQLAEATQADLATTSDQVTDSMSAMGVGIEDLQGYLDVVVQTNNSANTTASDLMDAFIKCGGAARAAGLDYQEAATALGILANNGTKGKKAGTALNSMLVRMTSNDTALTAFRKIGVSVYDASGNMRDFKDILVDTNGALDGMTESEQNAYMSAIAGTNYYTQFQYLLEGVKDGADGTASSWDSLTDALDNSSGALEAMDESVMGTMQGALYRFSSAVDDVKISFMDAFGDDIAAAIDFLAAHVIPKISGGLAGVSKIIGKVADVAGGFFDILLNGSDAVNTVTKFMDKHKTALSLAAIAVGALATALVAYNAPAIIAATTSAIQTAGIWLYVTATDAAAVATGAFSAVLGFLTSPIVLIIGAIAGLVAIGAALYYNWDTLVAKAQALAAAITERFPFMASIVQAAGATISNIATGIKTIFEGIITFIKGVFAGDWSAAWDGIVTTFGGIFGTLGGIATAPINAVIAVVNSAIQGINSLSVTIPKWVPKYGGKTLGFSLPTIPTVGLAEGGIVTDATNATIGEGGEPEAVLPLSKLVSLLEGYGVRSGGGITFAPVININGGSDQSEIETALGEAFERFKIMMQQYEHDKKRKAFA